MSELALDTVSIGSGGSTERGSVTKDPANDTLPLLIRGDAETANLDVEADAVSFATDEDMVTPNFTNPSVTSVDVTGDANNDQAVALTGLRGFTRIGLAVTNNHDAATTVTVEHADY